MEAREDQGFLLRPVALQVDDILLLDIDKAVEDAQPRIALADLSQKYATGYSPSWRGGLPA